MSFIGSNGLKTAVFIVYDDFMGIRGKESRRDNETSGERVRNDILDFGKIENMSCRQIM